jgi:hypothetical protein
MGWNRIKRRKWFNLYLSKQYMLRNRAYILFLYIFCFHLMIILSRSYGTEGLSGNSTCWDTPNHHAVQQTNLRIKQPRNSSEAKRSWPLLYTSKWWSSLAALRCGRRVGFHTRETGRYFQREELFIGFWHGRNCSCFQLFVLKETMYNVLIWDIIEKNKISTSFRIVNNTTDTQK